MYQNNFQLRPLLTSLGATSIPPVIDDGITLESIGVKQSALDGFSLGLNKKVPDRIWKIAARSWRTVGQMRRELNTLEATV